MISKHFEQDPFILNVWRCVFFNSAWISLVLLWYSRETKRTHHKNYACTFNVRAVNSDLSPLNWKKSYVFLYWVVSSRPSISWHFHNDDIAKCIQHRNIYLMHWQVYKQKCEISGSRFSAGPPIGPPIGFPSAPLSAIPAAPQRLGKQALGLLQKRALGLAPALEYTRIVL